MKTFAHLSWYLAEVFLDWEMFQKISYRESLNTSFMLNNFSQKIVAFVR
jgi:hypothetical protein